MKKIQISCRITCLEDFHIGSGSGSIGLYDAGQIKDSKGNPQINSSTIKGLLRDSCAILDRAYIKLGVARNSYYNQLFKTHENLSSLDIGITPIVISDNATIIHYFTAVDNSRRKADNATLRSVEFGSCGTAFDLQIEYLDRSGEAEQIAEYLKASLLNIKAIGGHRRRGFGAVSISELKDSVTDLVLDKDVVKEGSRVKLVLELQEDTLLSARAQSGNLLLTNDYITGTTILGMFRSLAQGKGTEKTYLDDGNVRSSFFYPLPHGCKEPFQTRICPVPLSFRKLKPRFSADTKTKDIPVWALDQGGSHKLKNILSHNQISEPEGERDAGKGMYEGYLFTSVDDTQWQAAQHYKVSKLYHQRNKVDDNTQSTQENGVFIEEKIVSGTQFVGDLSFKSEILCQEFVEDFSVWLQGKHPLHLGKGGRKALIKAYSQTIPEQKEAFEPSTDFVITLLSDAILCNDDLQPVKTITTGVLANAIGEGFAAEEFINVQSFARSGVISSFSGTSGLRKFRDVSIRKGSCFRFRYSGDDAAKLSQRLAEVGQTGIGFRKGEGFGMISINHPLHKLKSEKHEPKAALSRADISDTESRRLSAVTARHLKAEVMYQELNKHKLEGNWKSMVGDLIVKFEANTPYERIKNILQAKMDQNSPLGFWALSDTRYQIAALVITWIDQNEEVKTISEALKLLLKRKDKEA